MKRVSIKREEAKKWLRYFIAEAGGEVSVSSVMELGHRRGFHRRLLTAVATELGVESVSRHTFPNTRAWKLSE